MDAATSDSHQVQSCSLNFCQHIEVAKAQPATSFVRASPLLDRGALAASLAVALCATDRTSPLT